MEEVLIKSDIPYKIVGGIKFYERKEIKDMLAYLRLIANPNDDVSLRRILNVPKRGIGEATEEKLQLWANDQNESIFALLEQPESFDLNARTAATLRGFREMIDTLRQQSDFLSVTELVEEMLKKTGIQEELRREKTIEAESRLENIEEFLSVTQEFEKKNEEKTLVAFLTDLALISDLDAIIEAPDGQAPEQPTNAVTLMTMHSAKGLEFPYVYIIGMEEGIFPHSRALLEPDEMEEERRLAYVGITRAEKILHLTCAAVRMQFGRTMSNKPSRFLDEISDNLLEKHTSRSARQFESAPRMRGKSEAATGMFGAVPAKPVTPSNVAQARSAGLFGDTLPTFGGAGYKTPSSVSKPSTASSGASSGGLGDVRSGDKVQHAKWGIGTIVSTKGEGDDQELQVAFPAPVGVKRLLAKFAPLTKV
jgi:DNA helicase-2/ATP-dependent DNA helicase PcrA